MTANVRIAVLKRHTLTDRFATPSSISTSPPTPQHLSHRMMPQPERIRHARAEHRAQVHAEGVSHIGAAGRDEFVFHHARLAGYGLQRQQLVVD